MKSNVIVDLSNIGHNARVITIHIKIINIIWQYLKVMLMAMV